MAVLTIETALCRGSEVDAGTWQCLSLERFVENMTTRRSSSLGGDAQEVTRKAAESDAQHATRGTSTDPAGMKSALLVSQFSEDHRLLSQISLDKGRPLHLTQTLGSALVVLRELPIPVVIAERAFQWGTGKTFLRHCNCCHTVPCGKNTRSV
jgi:hypothetical protein